MEPECPLPRSQVVGNCP